MIMRKMWSIKGLREGLLLICALAVGWWAHGGRRVEAASSSGSGDFQFQLQPGGVGIEFAAGLFGQ
jgi:hypothetical protein